MPGPKKRWKKGSIGARCVTLRVVATLTTLLTACSATSDTLISTLTSAGARTVVLGGVGGTGRSAAPALDVAQPVPITPHRANMANDAFLRGMIPPRES